MEILIYNDLEFHKLKKQFDKTVTYLKAGDFRSADVKKLVNTDFYRAKLDETNRLLFKIGDHNGKKYLLLLEVILNHRYEKSRFLNGAPVDDAKLTAVTSEKNLQDHDIPAMGFINANQKHFHVLDKILSFDDTQTDIINLPLPVIVIGSAGSGKTALTLEKAKTLPGRVLYTTLSPYLVENAQNLYYSYEYENPKQEIEFLSFYEYVSSFEVPRGHELGFRAFEQWAGRYRVSHKIKDCYKLFEEFKGVLTGSVVDKPYLTEDDYLNLGIKQSIFPEGERKTVYDLFSKYLEWLPDSGYFDTNLIAHNVLHRIEPTYDYVVIDEVQDITNVQLSAILKSLNTASNFILCGDSNQIVHPNFFSWSQVKSLFYKQDLRGNIIRVLATNYRNTPEVTHIANKLLLIKNARFGSIDKESSYLVKPNSTHRGVVEFLENQPKINADLNRKTSRSAKFAVIVLRDEDKPAAKSFFQTPLLFSIHEAKGLEYENIILYNVVSSYEKEFRELVNGVAPEDLEMDAIRFSRAKDKSDKSLDEYKFYVNALYVGITRAVKNLHIVESNKKHGLLQLLGLTEIKQQSALKDQSSSQEEWQQEARRLEMQGKKEQAEAIRKDILQVQPVPWEVITREKFDEIVEKALHPENFNKKAKDKLFEYALYYGEVGYFDKLAELKYRPAEKWEQEGKGIQKRMFSEYVADNLKAVLPKFQRYGVNFRNELNLTPFMLSINYGAENIMKYLAKNGAQTDLTDNYGRNALQMVILKAYSDPQLKAKTINRLYASLKSSSIRVKVENRLIKIDSHQAEFLMLSFMLAVLRPHMIKGTTSRGWYYRPDPDMPTFQARDFLNFYEGLSEQVLPEFRKKRAYLSSILAKNEVNGADKYNKKLFVRLRIGHYLPSPTLELLIDELWINVYDLIDLNDIIQNQALLNTRFLYQIQRHRRLAAENPATVFESEG
jgi:hypothetical protein